MKFFIVFSALVAAALATPGAWTLNELSEIIQDPNTDPALLPIFNNALDDLMQSIYSGSAQTTITVSSNSHDLSAWTLNELSEALQNPETDAALVPYLESALNAMMSNIMSGLNQDYVIVATPVGILPVEATPLPVEAPVAPELVVAPTPVSASSPLVQIIVNVKSQESADVSAPIVPPATVESEIAPPQIIAINPISVDDFAPIVPPSTVESGIAPPQIIAVNPISIGDYAPIVPPSTAESGIAPPQIIAVNPINFP